MSEIQEPFEGSRALENGVPRFRTSPSRILHVMCQIVKVFSSIAVAFLPSWLQPPKDEYSLHNKPHPTAYLDGLRGLVAVLVFVRHFALPWQQHLDYGYGHDGFYGFLRLPYLRLFFSGPLVPIFFIISGYVLSAKSLKLSRSKSLEAILIALSGSIFRRAIRLFLPPIISTFFVMIVAYLGFFSFPYEDMPGRIPVHPEALQSLWVQIIQWGDFSFNELTNPWRLDVPLLLYGPHLWTIPISFRGSMVVFLACLCLIRTRSYIRIGMLVLVILTALPHERWDMASFLSGILLCEMDINRKLPLQATAEKARNSFIQKYIGKALTGLCFFLGLYLGSFPRYNQRGESCVIGYQWCCRIGWNYRYWHGVGAYLFMLALSRSSVFRRPLESALLQYLGRISFSIYIVHEPFLHIFAFHTVPLLWTVTGKETIVGYQVGFLIAMSVSAFLLVWLADLFELYVKTPCDKFSSWLESICFT